QTLRADLIITTGGTGTGPGDMVRRILSRGPVSFTDVSVYPCSSLGFGSIGGTEVPVVCLPGDPGAALIGFEVLARPVIQVLAGAEPVFRPSVRAHLLAPGWPAVLADGPVTLRPYHRADARAWSEVRRVNERWLAPWEPTPPGSWAELNAPSSFRYVLRELRRSGRTGEAMPFAVVYSG